MIIFAKADGQIVSVDSSPVYQGSSLRGNLYLVAPFPITNNEVYVGFELPNGNTTLNQPMTPTSSMGLPGFEDKLGNGLNVWVWEVNDASVTSLAGEVKVQFTIKTLENQVYSTITTVTEFTVLEGVPVADGGITESEVDILNSQIASINAKLSNPLITSIGYDAQTGEFVITYNNQSETTTQFPAIISNGVSTSKNSTKVEFTISSWSLDTNTNNYKMIYNSSNVPSALFDSQYMVEVYELLSTNNANAKTYTRMTPTINMITNDIVNGGRIEVVDSQPYDGIIIFSWGGNFISEQYQTFVEQQIDIARQEFTEQVNNELEDLFGVIVNEQY